MRQEWLLGLLWGLEPLQWVEERLCPRQCLPQNQEHYKWLLGIGRNRRGPHLTNHRVTSSSSLLWDRYSQADALKYVGIERETDVF